MNKIVMSVGIAALLLSGCTSMSFLERREYQYLRANGIDVNHPIGDYEAPNSLVAAAALNILPGFGNFYLASGAGNDSSHALFGALNLFTWPLSIVWGIPEAAIDANTLNKKYMLYYYHYDPSGKKAMQERGLKFE